MPIEKSIYTCVRTRRDTQTVGFGYYTFTAGFNELAQACPEVRRASVSYAAPRNQELWWSCAEDEAARDREESENISIHHPISFTYQPVECEGKQLAVFSYGKNLGRDIEKTRPGNVLITMLAADAADVQEYPFRYYESPDLFLPYDTNYFYENGEQIPPLLPNPDALTPGRAVTDEDIIRFIRDDRIQHLCSMFQIMLDYHDPEQPTRQIILCDEMGAVIDWIAALSLLLPKELAKKFSFTTYSFLAQRADDFRPDYENVMLCGVYSPALNGDPADSRTTNYQYSTEASREGAAVFDFEQESFADMPMRSTLFESLTEAAFSGDMQLLREYQDFLMQHTAYRGLDNDYLRGYSFYQLCREPDSEHIGCLADAFAFAEKYTDGSMMAEILEKLMDTALTQSHCGVSEHGKLLEYAGKIFLNLPAAKKQEICRKYMNHLRTLLVSEEASVEDYKELRSELLNFCDAMQLSYDSEFAAVMPDEEVYSLGASAGKRWVLLECADILLYRIQQTKFTPADVTAQTGIFKFYRGLLCRILMSNKKINLLLDRFVNAFSNTQVRGCLLEMLYAEAEPEGQQAIAAWIAETMLSDDQNTAGCMMQAIVGSSFCDAAMQVWFDRLSTDETIRFADIRAELNLLFSSDRSYQQRYAQAAYRCLQCKMHMTDSPAEALDNIAAVFCFAQNLGLTAQPDTALLFNSYLHSLNRTEKWYEPDEKKLQTLRQMLDEAVKAGVISEVPESYCNLIWMYTINQISADPSNSKLMRKVQQPFSFEALKFDHAQDYDMILSRIGKCLFGCVVAEDTVRIDYFRMFPNLDPEFRQRQTEPYTQIMKTILYQIAEEAPRKKRVMLAAEQLGVMCLFCNMDHAEIAKTLHKNGIRYNDLAEFYDNSTFVQNIGYYANISNIDPRIKQLRTKLQAAYEDAKSNTFFGKLFGKGGK